jgi:hypothetical protein
MTYPTTDWVITETLAEYELGDWRAWIERAKK